MAHLTRRVCAVVCALGLFGAGATTAGAASVDHVEAADGVAHLERAPMWVRSDEKDKPPMLVYPGAGETKKPLVVMLHGMCDSPENECPEFAGASTKERALLCPRANLRCDGGGTIWSGKPELRVSLVNGFVERAAQAMPSRIDTSTKPTLVGFSLGSFVALDVAQRSPGKYKNLILLGAKVLPDAKLLKEAGIESVVLGAGDRDMMKWHMVGVAASLEKKGIRARFIGMGDVGHWFASDMDAWLAQAFTWLDEKAPGA